MEDAQQAYAWGWLQKHQQVQGLEKDSIAWNRLSLFKEIWPKKENYCN